eukprot:m.221026 g.221026  ORF g.221026 m.221026 type:complete len:259 (+) comp10499_c0_seq1:67-843(+)
MPFKPPPQPTCARCSKTVYPVDLFNCLDKTWHKQCFSCEVCKIKLTMNTYKGYDKLPYCKTHYPQLSATAVTDTPESLRLKAQSERQSVVAYHKAFESDKGHYTSSATDPSLERAKAAQTAISGVQYNQRGDSAPAPVKSVTAPPSSAPKVVAPVAAAPAPVHHEPEPEPEPEAHHEPEPEPEPVHEEPAHEEPAAPAAGGQRYKAVYDYDAADGDEVSFKEGDIIVDAVVIDDGWMRGTVESTGATGMLPSNYVEPE